MTEQELRWMEIGKAIERACEVLPIGTDLHIELENGAGSVLLYLPPNGGNDGTALGDWQEDTFAGQINSAIEAALEVENAASSNSAENIEPMLAQTKANTDNLGHGHSDLYPLSTEHPIQDPFEAADRAISHTYPGEHGMWGAQRIPNFGILRSSIAREISNASAVHSPQSHSDDIAVDRFAAAMKAKMARSRAKGRDGWDDPTLCPVERLQRMLIEHLPKGDPVDIANFAMMLYHRGAPVVDEASLRNEPR